MALLLVKAAGFTLRDALELTWQEAEEWAAAAAEVERELAPKT